MTERETIAQLRAELAKAQADNAKQGLTLVTLCDMVLGENTNDASDDTLIRGVRRLLNEKSEANADNARLAALLVKIMGEDGLKPDIVTAALRDLLAPLSDDLQEIDRLASWHSDDEADPANATPRDQTAHVNGLVRQVAQRALARLRALTEGGKG